ncbi:MAG: metallophosphoesterase [Bacteroidales bacterium]|nr:metallophosphoesterase [Bacteroidales bacterium]
MRSINSSNKFLFSLFCFLLLAIPQGFAGNFRVAFVGDPQVDNEEELRYAQKSIYKELRERKDLDMVIILGDVVNDNTEWLAPSFESLDSLPCPWICVPGNHDRNYYKKASSRYPGKKMPQRARDLHDFKKLNGYIDTSFVKRGVRFICMNNVRTVETRSYEAGFSSSQKQWLDSLMQISQKLKTIVFCTHIPMSQSTGLDSLSVILRNHPSVYFVSGHSHHVLRHRLTFTPKENACPGAQKMDYEELVAGAACGMWWRGPKGEDGIPYALMNSSDPRGYYIGDFYCGKWQKMQYKSVGNRLRASVTRRDSKLIINVFGGESNAKVSLRSKQCGARWINAKISEEISEELRLALEFNHRLSSAEKKARRKEIIPLRKRKCKHLWETDGTCIQGNEVYLRYDDGLYRFEERLTIR